MQSRLHGMPVQLQRCNCVYIRCLQPSDEANCECEWLPLCKPKMQVGRCHDPPTPPHTCMAHLLQHVCKEWDGIGGCRHVATCLDPGGKGGNVGAVAGCRCQASKQIMKGRFLKGSLRMRFAPRPKQSLHDPPLGPLLPPIHNLQRSDFTLCIVHEGDRTPSCTCRTESCGDDPQADAKSDLQNRWRWAAIPQSHPPNLCTTSQAARKSPDEQSHVA
jgi:hypothetical protein